WLFAGELNCLLQVRNFVALARSQEQMNRILRIAGNVIVKVDVGDVEGNVFLCVPRERLLKFFAGHLRQDDVLNNYGVPINAGGYFRGLDFVLIENISDSVRNRVQLHNLTVYDAIRLQAFIAQTQELKVTVLTLQLDGFDRTRADINADHAFLTTFPHHE